MQYCWQLAKIHLDAQIYFIPFRFRGTYIVDRSPQSYRFNTSEPRVVLTSFFPFLFTLLLLRPFRSGIYSPSRHGDMSSVLLSRQSRIPASPGARTPISSVDWPVCRTASSCPSVPQTIFRVLFATVALLGLLQIRWHRLSAYASTLWHHQPGATNKGQF